MSEIKEDIKRRIEILLDEKNAREKEIKEILWDYYYAGTLMPESFPYKKWLREDFDIII